MAKSHETSSDRSDRDRDPDVRQQLAEMQTTLRTMMERLGDNPTIPAPRPPARPHRVAGMATTEISPALQRLIAEAHEPKRQRKTRSMPSRAVYRCKPATSAAMIRALQDLTPAAKTIFFFLVDHPRVTVPQIAAGVDLKEKTVANLLSVMKREHLILSEKK